MLGLLPMLSELWGVAWKVLKIYVHKMLIAPLNQASTRHQTSLRSPPPSLPLLLLPACHLTSEPLSPESPSLRYGWAAFVLGWPGQHTNSPHRTPNPQRSTVSVLADVAKFLFQYRLCRSRTRTFLLSCIQSFTDYSFYRTTTARLGATIKACNHNWTAARTSFPKNNNLESCSRYSTQNTRFDFLYLITMPF